MSRRLATKKIHDEIQVNNIQDNKRVLKTLCIILVCAFLTEVFVCNFRFFQTFRNVKLGGYDVTYGSGLIIQDNGTFYLNSDGDRKIELTGINYELKNIKIDIERENANWDLNEENYRTLSIKLKAKDEANSVYYSLPNRTVVKGNERSKYIALNLSGVVESLIIDLNSYKDCYIRVNEIVLNAVTPFEFIVLRFWGIAVLYILIWMIINVKFWKDVRINLKSPVQNCVTAVILVAQLTMMWFLANSNLRFNEDCVYLYENSYKNWNYIYYDLVESLDEGIAYIDAEVDENLAAMGNPYDSGLRSSLGISFKWDYAFYDGKYYVYFGIVPALLVYLPYYKIMGEHIPNSNVVTIGIVFACIFMMLLLRKLAQKYAPRLPLPLFYMLYLVASNAVGCAFMVSIPSFYSVPIIFGIAFAMGGLYLWLCAVDSVGIRRYVKLFFGALCMALVAGCRPQLLLSSFLFIPVIGLDWLKKWKEKERKQLLIELAVVAVPYLIIAAGLMYYNAIRFGSPFDFGANYNLTTNDMTHRGWKWDRAGLGLFYYLFNPIRFGSSFPFINSYNVETVFQGRTISESMYGGALSICPLTLVGIYALFIPKLHSEKKARIFHIMCVAAAFIIVIVDTQMSGILYRYMADFMLFLIVPSCMAVMKIFDGIEDNPCYVHCWRIFMCAMFCSFIVYNLLYFAPEYRDLKNMNPGLFYRIANAVQIWL